MIGDLVCPRKDGGPNCPIFQPVLESLESREFPSAPTAQTELAELPAAVGNPQASLSVNVLVLGAVHE
jgi:hypothetical protein